MTQCQPAESQKETEAPGSCRELQAGIHEKTTHSADAEEGSRGSVNPKKTAVLIVVAPPTDLQQVGGSRWLYSLVELTTIHCRARPQV